MKKKKNLIFSLIIIINFNFCFFKVEIKGKMTNLDYKKILSELGALEVKDLNRKLWINIEKPEIYDKGERIDVNGWLSPYDFYLLFRFAEYKKKNDFPPPADAKIRWYHKYKYLLNVQKFKESSNMSIHFTVISFLLDTIIYEKIPHDEIKNDIIKLYKETIGLEDKIVLLYKNKLPYYEAIELFEQKFRNSIDFFPIPQKDDVEYIHYLERSIRNKCIDLYSRIYFCKFIIDIDKNQYSCYFYKLIENNDIFSIKEWYKRVIIYDILFMLKNKRAQKIISKCLLIDSNTEAREHILHEMCINKMKTNEILDSIEALIQGKGKAHFATMKSRGPFQWRFELFKYLKCIKNETKKTEKNYKRIEKLFNIQGKSIFGDSFKPDDVVHH